MILSQNTFTIRRIAKDELNLILSPETIAIPATSDGVADLTAAEFSVKVLKGGKELFPVFDESIVGKNLLLSSNSANRTNIASNSTEYPVTVTSIKEGTRNFCRVKRSNTALNPTVLSLYNSLELSYLSQDILGKEVTVSFEARASSETTATLDGREYAPNRNLPFYGKNVDVSTEWKRFHVTFVKSEDLINGLRICLGRPFIVGDVNDFYVDMCRWQVKLGNIVDDWAPDPSEILSLATLTTHNCSAAIVDDKVKITSLTPGADAGWVDLTVTYGDGFTSTKRFTWAKAKSGVSVTLTDVEYAVNTSTTVAPTTGWSTTAPSLTGTQQLWTRTKTTYSAGSPTYTIPVNITPKTGADGAVGTGVESITEEYYLSTSKMEQIGGSWVTTPPAWSSKKYIWTRSKITYKNPTSTAYTTPICSSEWEAVNGLEISNRNLLLKSGVPVSNASYPTKRYDLADLNLKHGETVSIRLKGVLGEGKTSFQVYNSGGNVGIGALVNNGDGTYSMTTTWKVTSGSNTALNTFIQVYPIPNTITGVTSSIEWIMLVRGDKPPKDWSPSPEDLQTDINTARQAGVDAQITANAAQTSVNSLNTYVDGAFKDGVVSEAEAKAIEKYKNTLAETMAQAEASYNKVYANAYLEGTAKTNLLNAKVNLWGQRDTLLTTINNAIADGKTTVAEKNAVDLAFATFNTLMGAFQNALEDANKAIQVKLDAISKGYVDGLQIGSVNLLRNSTFNFGRDFWSASGHLSVLSPESDKPSSAIMQIQNTNTATDPSAYFFNTNRVFLEPKVGDTLIFAFDYFCENFELNSATGAIITLRRSTAATGGTVTAITSPSLPTLKLNNSNNDGKWVRVEWVYTFTETHAIPAWFIFGLYLSNNTVGRTVRYKFREIMWVVGNKIVGGWSPAPEDVEAKIEEAAYLKAALKKSTEIEGGLILSSVIATRDSGGIVRSYQSGDPALNNIAFAAGVINFGKTNETQKIALRHDGSGFLASGSIAWDATGNTVFTGTVIATAGVIGGFTIGSSYIGAGSSWNGSANGMSLWEDFIVFNKPNRQALIGATSSLGFEFLGRFVDTTNSGYLDKTGIMFNVSGSSGNNTAIALAKGHISGLAIRTRQISSGTTLTNADTFVTVYHSTAGITIYLPASPEVGEIKYIYCINNPTIYIHGNGKNLIQRGGSSVGSIMVTSGDGNKAVLWDGQYWIVMSI